MQKSSILFLFFINKEKNCSDISVLQRDILSAIPAIAISGTRHEGNNTFKSPEVMAAV